MLVKEYSLQNNFLRLLYHSNCTQYIKIDNGYLLHKKSKIRILKFRMRQKADDFTCNFESEGKRKIENNKKGRS